MFKSDAKQSNGMAAMHELFLNGFHLSLSSETFSVHRMALPDNKQLKGLRREHDDWFIYWREGFLYAVPGATIRPNSNLWVTRSPYNAANTCSLLCP